MRSFGLNLMRNYNRVGGIILLLFDINKDGLQFTLTKCLILNKPIKRYPQRKEEGKLLRKVIGKEVVNIARYYYHETVYIGGKEDNIYKNVHLIMPLKPAGVKISIRKGRSSNKNRLFSYTNALLPPSKRTYLGSLPLGGRRPITLNRAAILTILKGNVVNRFNKWNSIDTEELAEIKKGAVANKEDFLKTISDNFLLYY
ncbi:hypothetical protein V2W45_1465102 [Cenococcum geophilum]